MNHRCIATLDAARARSAARRFPVKCTAGYAGARQQESVDFFGDSLVRVDGAGGPVRTTRFTEFRLSLAA
jgi:hypothetical protein